MASRISSDKRTYTFSLASANYIQKVVKVSYTHNSGTNDVEDLDGTNMADFSNVCVTNASTLDIVPPELLTSVVAADGQSIVLTFSEDISAANDVQTDSFVIKVNGSPITPATVSGSDTVFTLNLASADYINQFDEVLISYTFGGTSLTDDGGTQLANFAETTVINNADTSPYIINSQVTGTNTVTLEFSEELVGGSTNAFAVSTNGEQHGEWVHGEWINSDVDVGYGCAAWR